ncbi:unnamed protein product [Rhizophagus irregularis]|nr:unnamed protein product [Rhizophagus irregularis]
MRKSRLSLTKPFSLRESTNFSGRNILQKHRHLGSSLNTDNKEGSETELQDEMEVESDNYHNEKNNNDDISIEENNDHYSEADNYISEENDDNYGEEVDNYDEEADDNHIEEENDNYGEEDDYNDENVYYDDDDDDGDNIIDDNDNYEEKIVDSSIDSDHMLNINGSFAPYFENLTSALLFCWVQKYNICKFISITNAFNGLF